MDWGIILYKCIIWLLFVAVFFAGLYALIAIPMLIITTVLGLFWSILRLLLPFLPKFSDMMKENSTSRSKKSSIWDYGKTEAEKHSELIEHIRIQQINQDRNRR
ncbi:hypothetical protein [Neisseria montereyensis]|uniref:Uncharacterized protein n=1 Tax=Neisseria montereyensis TaxID=2973938 RepID=A0ABT2FCU0_9NEIS|nr:hypothetical protein [Neisseria montereyensis]MCS4534027.1 hypothetical protein [Neisseria montereyensis]